MDGSPCTPYVRPLKFLCVWTTIPKPRCWASRGEWQHFVVGLFARKKQTRLSSWLATWQRLPYAGSYGIQVCNGDEFSEAYPPSGSPWEYRFGDGYTRWCDIQQGQHQHAASVGKDCWPCKVTCTHPGLLKIANPSNYTYCMYH